MMERSESRQKIGELLYLIYFVLMIGARAIGLYEGQTVLNAIYVVAMLLFAAHMIVTKHTVLEYVITFVLLMIAGVVYLHTGEKGLLICFTMLLGMKGVDRIRVIKSGAVVSAVCVAFRIFTGVFGILPEKYYPQTREGVGLMFRHSLGYVHPNTLHMNVLMLTMLTLFLVTYRLREEQSESDDRPAPSSVLVLCLVSAIALGANIYVFMYSGSRTGLLVSVVYLCVNFRFYVRRKPGPAEKIVCFSAYPAAAFATIVFPFILKGNVFDRIDTTVFNTRFTIARYFWDNNRISLFGIRLNNPDPLYRTYGLDMAYMYLFFQLGIMAFAVITILTFLYVRHALKRGYMTELAVLMAVLFAGIWEPFLYNSGFKNFTFVFMGAALYETLSGMMPGTFAEELTKVTDVHKDRMMKPGIVICSVAAGILAGVIGSGLYLAVTSPPDALYADRQEDEAGVSFDMEPMYLTPADIDSFRSRGDLIVGYVDEHTPMYMYDTGIAVMEYHKKAVSIGVWAALAVALIICGTNYVRNMRILHQNQI